MVVRVVLYCSMYCLCVNVYCHRVTTQLQLTNISNNVFVGFMAIYVVLTDCLLVLFHCKHNKDESS